MAEKLNVNSLGESKKTGNPDQLRYNCVFCDDDKYHLYVQFKKGVFHCHKCKTSGKLKDLKRYPTSLSELKEKVNLAVKGGEEYRSEVDRIPLRLPVEFRHLTPSTGLPYRYLRDRRVTDEEMERYSIGYCSEGFYGERIILPIYDKDELKYYVGRTYTNRIPKYLNAQSHRDQVIFKTFDGAVKRAVVVEGIFGALRIGKVFPTIALLGKTMSEHQMKLICQSTRRAYILLDPDAYGDTMQVAKRLNYYIEVCPLIFGSKELQKCPDEMNPNYLIELLGDPV